MSENNQTDQYKLGYDSFNLGNVMSMDDLKKMHPFFRRGYRTAQQEASSKLQHKFPTVLYDIPTKEMKKKYNPSWDDIVSSTKRPRFNRLQSKRMEPILMMMMRAVDAKKDKIYSYSDVTRMMDKAFDIVLQYAYDEGILNEFDLKQYFYVPVKSK